MEQRQPVGLDRQQARAALDHQRERQRAGGRQHEVPAGPAHPSVAQEPVQAECAERDRDREQRLEADPEAERCDHAGGECRPPLGLQQQTDRQAELDHEQGQQQAVVVRSADDRVGLNRGLEQEGKAGEQPRVAAEDRGGRPVEGEQCQRQQHRADQHAPEMEAGRKAEHRLEQPGAAQQQHVQQPGPVLDVALGRVDPQQPGIERVAARVQVQDPDQAHVGVGVGEFALEHGHDREPGEQGLEQHQGAERQQDQPAERRPVRRRSAD